MRRFVTILTAVMLFAHALLGCCSHHVHACGQTHDQMAWTGEKHCADAAHEHPTGNSERSSDEHQRNDDCRGNKCDLGRTADEPVAKSYSPFSPLMALPPSEADQASACGQLGDYLCTDGALQPVRLHLVNHVLLI